MIAPPALPSPAPYDPLRTPARPAPPVDLTAEDPARGRRIPLRACLPSAPGPAPVILVSHGLGGSRETSAYLGAHWAARGYAVVFLQHPGSDEGVWQGLPPREALAALQRAANADQLRARIGDVEAVLDRLEAWNRTPGHPLAGRLDLDRIGMCGHSFGAVTAQAVSGERFPDGGPADPRIRAALLMSPSAPRQGSPAAAFGAVGVPWMLMTGTRDVARIGGIGLASRLAVFPALPPGDKYELVLEGAEHAAFTDRPLPGSHAPRNPAHHRAVLALGTAFWDAHLRGDPDARAWLDGTGPRSVLAPGDRWRRK